MNELLGFFFLLEMLVRINQRNEMKRKNNEYIYIEEPFNNREKKTHSNNALNNTSHLIVGYGI